MQTFDFEVRIETVVKYSLEAESQEAAKKELDNLINENINEIYSGTSISTDISYELDSADDSQISLFAFEEEEDI